MRKKIWLKAIKLNIRKVINENDKPTKIKREMRKMKSWRKAKTSGAALFTAWHQ
jgi:hypothetical protein